MTNTKNATWLYLVCGILITANIISLVLLWIHRGHEGPPEGPGRRPNLFEYVTTELNFSKEQKDAYDLLRNEHQQRSRNIQDSIRVAKDALFNMLQENNVSENAIAAQSNKSSALTASLDTMTFHHFQKVRALCNPDQQKKFDNIIQVALRTMGPQQGPHGNRPPPPGN